MDVWIGLGAIGLIILAFIGWSNRLEGRAKPNVQRSSSGYVEGLNYLLDEKPDRAVEVFMASLDVNTDTLETHLALGKLMRRQGYVERAIRIHQNVLARPSLAPEEQHQIHLELARDFMSAGLLDRAEMLLNEVVEESVTLRSLAQRYLMEIYQDESEWQQAINVAKSLLQSKYVRSQAEEKKYVTRLISHFYSELAIEAKEAGDTDAARQYLNKAISADKTGVRVAVLNAARLNAEGSFRQAIKSLAKVGINDPAWFAGCLPTLLESFEGLHPTEGVEQLWQHLKEKSNNKPAASDVLFVVKTLINGVENDPSLKEQAVSILKEYLDQNSNLALSNIWLGLQLSDVSHENAAYLKQLHHQLEDHIQQQKLYRCEQCGFSGRQLNWRCPSCKHWDSCQRVDEAQAI